MKNISLMMKKHPVLSAIMRSFENIFLDKELNDILVIIDEAHNLNYSKMILITIKVQMALIIKLVIN